MRIYCIPTDKKLNTEQTVIEYYKSYCTEKGIPFNSSVQIKRSARGKPYFEDSDIHFSVSHTNALSVICFATHNIGIDCESTEREIKHFDLIKSKVFSVKEQKYAVSKERFIEIWVKKEAYIKYKGLGLPDIRYVDTFSVGGNFNLTYFKKHIICTYYE